MPELPEVETVRRSLKLKLIDRKILYCDVYYDNIIEYPSVMEFKKNIVSQTFRDIKRYGKWLEFILDDYVLFCHLRMEGKFFFKDKDTVRDKHEHVIFGLDNGIQFRYMDVRKFGKMELIRKEDIDKMGPLIKIGLEPWDDRLDANYLRDKFKNKKLPIKSAIMDQSIIAGIGNIYANEILYASLINPYKSANDVSILELNSIIENTKKILESSIEKGGSTIHSYTSVDGVTGLFQNELKVHMRDGQPCYRCGSVIEKDFIGGRSVYYCPKCQSK